MISRGSDCYANLNARAIVYDVETVISFGDRMPQDL